MTDTPRDVRDRLGEMWRAVRRMGEPDEWGTLAEDTREAWRVGADRVLLPLAASCGLKIVPDDGEAK